MTHKEIRDIARNVENSLKLLGVVNKKMMIIYKRTSDEFVMKDLYSYWLHFHE